MHHHSPSRLAHACDLESRRKRNRAAAGRRRPRRRRPDAPPTRTNRWRAPARARTAVLGRHAHLLPAARGRLMPRCRCWSGRAGRWRLGRPLHARSRSLERLLVGKSWGVSESEAHAEEQRRETMTHGSCASNLAVGGRPLQRASTCWWAETAPPGPHTRGTNPASRRSHNRHIAIGEASHERK